jgi:hypothetical protein
MKPLKTLKAKKLTIKKETLRTLTESDLSRAGGGYMNTSGSDYCSSYTYTKCGGCGNTLSVNCHDP